MGHILFLQRNPIDRRFIRSINLYIFETRKGHKKFILANMVLCFLTSRKNPLLNRLKKIIDQLTIL